MVVLIEPQNQGELIFIKSLLDANGIRYFVRDEHVGSLYPGVPAVAGTVMVGEDDLDRASTLMSELRREQRGPFGQVRRLRASDDL
ncbi:putative signal transducing protein [Candidatus Nitrospira bockiana]